LSLADLSARTGITRSALCRLETDRQPNPTVTTLQRVAEALGKEIVVRLADRA
jgi:transcriptional regulator with XRE-family HTH domain